MRLPKQALNKLICNSINVKQNKYKNKSVEYNGIKFDSKKEMAYYIKLKLLEEKGIIRNLELQKPFELQPSFKLNGKIYREIKYIADFSYVSVEDNKLHIVDTKGFRTDVYKIKRKMFAYKYGIEIEEV